jgi:uncharacterized protein
LYFHPSRWQSRSGSDDGGSLPYWEHKPGSHERVLKMGKLIPEVTPEQAANAIVRGVERNKRLIVIPFMMKLIYWLHAVFP